MHWRLWRPFDAPFFSQVRTLWNFFSQLFPSFIQKNYMNLLKILIHTEKYQYLLLNVLTIDNFVEFLLRKCSQLIFVLKNLRSSAMSVNHMISIPQPNNEKMKKKTSKQIQFELRLVVTYSRCQQYNKIEIGGRKKKAENDKQQQSCIRACALLQQNYSTRKNGTLSVK